METLKETRARWKREDMAKVERLRASERRVREREVKAESVGFFRSWIVALLVLALTVTVIPAVYYVCKACRFLRRLWRRVFRTTSRRGE